MKTASKNPWGKTRPQSNPYAVLVMGGWEWRILKAYKGPAATRVDPYSRFFCAVSSPMTHGGYDLGDVYAKDVPGGIAAFVRAARALEAPSVTFPDAAVKVA